MGSDAEASDVGSEEADRLLDYEEDDPGELKYDYDNLAKEYGFDS